MLAIRFIRTGKKNQPFFRLIVTDKSNPPRGGRFLEILGFYNPLTKEKKVKTERVKYWLSVGAKPSDSAHNFLVSEKIIEAGKINVCKKSKKNKKTEEDGGGAGGEEQMTEKAQEGEKEASGGQAAAADEEKQKPEQQETEIKPESEVKPEARNTEEGSEEKEDDKTPTGNTAENVS